MVIWLREEFQDENGWVSFLRHRVSSRVMKMLVNREDEEENTLLKAQYLESIHSLREECGTMKENWEKASQCAWEENFAIFHAFSLRVSL